MVRGKQKKINQYGSACGPVIVPVFKTGERQAILSLVGSTPTRFRHLFPRACGQEPAKDPPSSKAVAETTRGGAYIDFVAAMMTLFILLWRLNVSKQV